MGASQGATPSDFPWIMVSMSMRTKTEVVPFSVFILPMETQNSLLQHPESYLSFFHCLLPSSPCWFSSFLKRSPLLLSWLVFHFSLSSILWSSPPHSRPSISFRSSIYLNLDSTAEVKKQKQVKPHKEFVFLWLVFLAQWLFSANVIFPFSVYPNGVFIHHIFLYHCIRWWASRLVPQLGCCEHCNIKCRCASISLSCLESFRFVPGHGVARSRDSSILSF